MKAIQITVDDPLLARIDRDPDVQRLGRSAVIRRAIDAYLRRRQKDATADAYRRAYGRKTSRELEGWSEEGVWPEALRARSS